MSNSILQRYSFGANTASRTYDACILGEINIDATVTSVNAIVDDFLSCSVKYRRKDSPHGLIVGFSMELIPTEDDLGINTIHLIATINFCIGRRVLIYHLPYLPYNVLGPFFADPKNIFVGLNVKDMLHQLKSAFGIGGNARHLDLGERAAEKYNRPELKGADLKGLCTAVLGKDLPTKELQLTEWENDLLSEAQVIHASVDVVVTHEIGRALLEPLPTESNQSSDLHGSDHTRS